MKAIPFLALLGAAACLGVYLGMQYLRRVRARPVMIGLHLLLGAGGLEALAVLLHGTPDGIAMPAGPLGAAAALLLALAMLIGLLAPMVGRGSRRTMNIALAAHAGTALAGFALLLGWVARSAW